MENKIMDEKSKLSNTLKIFKEQITLNSNKIKEEILDYEDFEDYEEVIEDDGDALQYLKDLNTNLIEEFTNFLIKYDIRYMPTINEFKFDHTPKNNLGNALYSTFIKTPTWLALKRLVLNPHNKDNKCFQYSITLSFYHKEIVKNFCMVSQIRPYINNTNWENTNFPPISK